MGEYKSRANFSEKRSKFIKNAVRHSHGIVADVEEDGFRSEDFPRACRFFSAVGLNFIHGHSGLTPELGGFASLAVGQANHSDFPTTFRIERDRTARAPDKVG